MCFAGVWFVLAGIHSDDIEAGLAFVFNSMAGEKVCSFICVNLNTIFIPEHLNGI